LPASWASSLPTLAPHRWLSPRALAIGSAAEIGLIGTILGLELTVTLSIVVLCWNDVKVIGDCLRSIYQETQGIDIEVIVSDNGSTDGSVEFIHQFYPRARVLENGTNLGFAKGNNEGIARSSGRYVLILNPDTIIRDRALEKWVAFADCHPEAGAFGCRVLNPDGSFNIQRVLSRQFGEAGLRPFTCAHWRTFPTCSFPTPTLDGKG